MPLLKCVPETEGTYILSEIHEGICGSHIGARSLVQKIMRARYFWPTMETDATILIRYCSKFQLQANVHRLPTVEFHSISNPIPFYQWGMDIFGPFLKARGNKVFLIIAIDHFSKWVEVKALASITEQIVKIFFWNEVITRFGVSCILITDNGKQLEVLEFQIFC